MRAWHGWLALALVALGLAWWIGRGDGRDKEREQFKADRAAFQNERAELRAERQILLDSLGAHAARDSAAKADADSVIVRSDRDRAARVRVIADLTGRLAATDTGRVAAIAREAIAAATAAQADADSLRSTLGRTRAAWDQTTRDLAAVLAHSERQETQLDSCNTLLNRAPIDEEKFLGIPLPSRKAVAVTTAVVTTIVTLVILK